MVLLWTWNLLANLCVRQNLMCSARSIFPPAKPAEVAHSPLPLSIMDTKKAHGLCEKWVAKAQEGLLRFTVMRNPVEEVIWWSEISFEAMCGALSWLN